MIVNHIKAVQKYLDEANSFNRKGKTEQAITAYKQAIKLKSELSFSYYLNLAQLLKQQGKDEEVATLLNSSKEGGTYSKIWNYLNQTTLEKLEEYSYYSTDIKAGYVYQYFNINNQVKVINLVSITEEEKLFIENTGLSLEYLNQNRKLVTKEGISQEETSQREINKSLQHLAAKDGYIYAVCPSTGKTLKSNRSLFSVPRLFFYRFVGNEIFYLVAKGGFQKYYLYFPKLELIVELLPNKILSAGTSRLQQNNEITWCKTTIVVNYQKIQQYFSNMENAKKVVSIGCTPSIGHHFFNELSGLYEAQKEGCLHQVDQFLVIGSEFYGGIDDIFKINSEKITRLAKEEVQNYIIEKKLFAFGLTNEFNNEKSCIHLIYEQSIEKCSPRILAEIEEAKNKYFPLLWINIRLNQRIWLEQEEGIVNIIKNLHSTFPNLGIVFDGFTRQERKGNLIVNAHEEAIIKQEQDFINKIQSYLPPAIKIYDNIGCFMYESVVWAKAVDLCLLTEGSSITKTRVFNKPDVTHCSHAFNKGMLNGIKKLDHVVDVYEGKRTDSWFVLNNTNYHCDWRVLYEQLVNLACSLQAKKYVQQGKIVEVITVYEKALVFNSSNHKLYLAIAGFYNQQNNWEKASESYQQAIQLKPDLPSVVYAGLAHAKVKQGKIEEAFSIYEEAIELNPNDHNLFRGIAGLYSQQETWEKASYSYQQAIKLKPNSPGWVYTSLAHAKVKQGKIEEAIAVYHKAIELYSDNPYLYDQLARLYARQKKWKKASESYQQAIKLEPNLNSYVYRSLAYTLNQQGREEEASDLISELEKRELN